MKTVLCFGDSNTWGYSPDLPRRYNRQERWTMRLQDLLPQYHIIEEGQNSRTTVFEDPFESGKKGLDYLVPCLESHHPDLVIIMLGTNDLKTRFSVTANDISRGAARLVQEVQRFQHGFMATSPEVLLISPTTVLEITPPKENFVGAEEKSQQLASFYQLRAEELGCHFLNAAQYVHACPKEGLHWQPEQHKIFANLLTKIIPKILS